MFFPYHPGAKNDRGSRVPRGDDDDGVGRAAGVSRAAAPLQPFHLKDVRPTARTAFHAAQQTNLAWLKQLEPDRMLYFRPQLAKYAAEARDAAALRRRGRARAAACAASHRPLAVAVAAGGPRAAPSPSSDRVPNTS